jgi:hypothetical protein
MHLHTCYRINAEPPQQYSANFALFSPLIGVLGIVLGRAQILPIRTTICRLAQRRGPEQPTLRLTQRAEARVRQVLQARVGVKRLFHSSLPLLGWVVTVSCDAS